MPSSRVLRSSARRLRSAVAFVALAAGRAAAIGPLALAGCHASAAASSSAPEPPPGEVWLTPAQMREGKIEVDVVREHEVDDTILASGTVTLEDQRSAHVFSPVTGRVAEIRAPLGGRVKKGDPLATIVSPDVGSAVSDVHKAEADLIAAEHTLRRRKDLYAEKAGTESELEVAEDAFRRAKAEFERAREKQAMLRVGVADAVTQTYVLTAPIDGEILMRNINPGIEVQGQYSGGAAQELFTIGELDHVWVLGDVYEMDLARVRVGDAAVVSVVAYPHEVFTGVVDWVSGSIDPASRTAKVRCAFDNADRKLRPMMYATVKLSVEKKQAIAVPRNAVLRLGADRVVFVETGEGDGRAHFRAVRLDVDEGESSPWLEVKSGLEVGQKIVVSGAILLAANM